MTKIKINFHLLICGICCIINGYIGIKTNDYPIPMLNIIIGIIAIFFSLASEKD